MFFHRRQNAQVALHTPVVVPEDFADKFSNELLAQTVHVMVASETSQLRSILVGRALSSTMIMQQSEPEADDKEKPSEELDSILKDWFEQNEKD